MRYIQAKQDWHVHLKADGVVFNIFVLARSHSGFDLPSRYSKQVKAIPKELKNELSGKQKVAAEEAAEAGELWYVKVDGDGWMWGTKNGAKMVSELQHVLTWLKQLETNPQGTEVFYAEVTNNFVKEG